MSARAADSFLLKADAFASDYLLPNAGAWSMGASPDPQIFRQAGEAGLLGVEVPEELGGQGLGFIEKLRTCEILAGADFGLAMSLVNSHNVAYRLCLSAQAAVRDRYLPAILEGQSKACTALTEPATGSDFAAITTRAVQDGDGWRLTGEKAWIVNGRDADVSIVFAQCAKVGQAAGIGAFLVDLNAEGVERYPLDSAFSQTSIGTGGFKLHDVQVPETHLLLPPGAAFKSILTEINGARAYVGAMCNGMLRAALKQAWAYGGTRRTFGKTLSEHQGWRQALASAEAGLAASEALVERAGRLLATGSDAQLAAAEAKVFAVECSQRHLPELFHAMGAEGLRPDYCFTRHIAASQIAGLTDGATTILRERIARLSQPGDTSHSNP